MELKLDRRLAMVYPLDKTGARITDPNFVAYGMVDSEMIKVTGNGALVERWKAEHLTEAIANFHETDADDLGEQGLQPGMKEYDNRIGGMTTRPKYKWEEIEQEDLIRSFQPINETAIKEIIDGDDSGTFKQVYNEFQLAIEMTLRANPQVNLQELFDGFAEVIEAREAK